MNSILRTIFMKKQIKYILPALVILAIATWSFSWLDANQKKEAVVMQLVYDALSSVHFQPRAFDDSLSAEVYDAFIESLDSEKRFLHSGDLEALLQHRLLLDDQIKAGSTDFFDEAMAILANRIETARGQYAALLNEVIDVTSPGELQGDASKRNYFADDKDMTHYWASYIQFRVVSRLHDRKQHADSAKALGFDPQHADFKELEVKAREKEMDIHDSWFKNMDEMERADWFGLYMNAFAGAFDPHSSYFPPRQQESFEIEMTGQLEGIGASLIQDGDHVRVSAIVTGSACWKQGELAKDDLLIAVAQGDKEPVDVVGMTTEKVVQLVRGKKGTEVRLTVLKVDGSEMVIAIVRDVVEIEATFAKSARLGDDGKTGYIRLPKFYVNFYQNRNRDCAEDIRMEIDKLKAAGMERLIFDLRGNGGGSLPAAIDVAGLFIDQGPVVQVKTSGQRLKTYKDDDAGTSWDGPLLILVDENTASASEIVAAAMQDHGRALIVGSPQTFGKGTVQTIIDMDRAAGPFYRKHGPLGAFKLTIQKYYRITGGTTQLQGVKSDIVLPHPYQYISLGERDMENPLAVDNIETLQYPQWESSMTDAIAPANKRIANSASFERIATYATWLRDRDQDSHIPLAWDDYLQSEADYQAEKQRFKNVLKSSDSIRVQGFDVEKVLEIDQDLNGDRDLAAEAEMKEEKNRRWHKMLSRDLYVAEAMRILQDMGRS
ncbi:MAG: carboxy terminal-processing peptidase [Flavobacteriales bacterium]